MADQLKKEKSRRRRRPLRKRKKKVRHSLSRGKIRVTEAGPRHSLTEPKARRQYSPEKGEFTCEAKKKKKKLQTVEGPVGNLKGAERSGLRDVKGERSWLVPGRGNACKKMNTIEKLVEARFLKVNHAANPWSLQIDGRSGATQPRRGGTKKPSAASPTRPPVPKKSRHMVLLPSLAMPPPECKTAAHEQRGH